MIVYNFQKNNLLLINKFFYLRRCNFIINRYIISSCFDSEIEDAYFMKKSENIRNVSYILFLFLFFVTAKINAQNGTYELRNKNGSYCYISFQKQGNRITAEIFAWWNTDSAQTGSYYGTASSNANDFELQSEENDPRCNVFLLLDKNKINASFENCATDHLTEDFNGVYTKITNATAGDYVVSVPKAWFHKKPDASTKLKTYVVKSDKVTLAMDRIIAGNWVNVYYIGANGQETSGYINLANLQKAD